MPFYQVLGGCLEADIPMDELCTATEQPPTWRMRTNGVAAAAVGCAELIGEQVEITCSVALHRCAGQLRLTHTCTGTFDFSENGSDILWHPAHAAAPDVVHADVTGRVLAVAMHMQGFLTLHASAVVIADAVVAFVASKGTGKSTLAASLVAVGCALATDDSLPVMPGRPPLASPGLQSMRLHQDSAALLSAHGRLLRRGVDGKHVMDRIGHYLDGASRLPLDAVYVVTPVPPSGTRGSIASRALLGASEAAITLVQHAKIGGLLGGSEAMHVFDRAATVAAATPVYTLHVERDLSRVREVAEQIMEWHHGDQRVGATD